ncbi:glycosyltransferase [Rhizobiaceae bacterium n13]|uniref:Glycosyltransferase n=1 Tax=Ferirhizobium litorale TaxID=2927786 RepID=A0AAE3Q9R2_9HYPH|nr:glycosyltransferase [Fererhizobium litorale]MDI7860718.1 glycosyltransferase [Fererhizobium litorale]MDI7920866.1 glycosyltransferase [Fererhizobium litorale]
MNILVYPHELEMGGSQINAIELAAAVRDRGHNVTVTAPDGVLSEMIRRLGLNFVPIPRRPFYPSVATAFELSALARSIKADLVHTYEWRPAVEGTFGPHLFGGTRILATVLSMDISHLLPRHVPLIVGTRELAEMKPRPRTWVLEPPIDTTLNETKNIAAARARWAFGSSEVVVSVVCRLTRDLEKLQGVLQAIDVIGELATNLPLRLIVAGDGPGRGEVDAAAAAVNRRHGHEIIVVTGQLLDPREAYDAADIILGMGSSALKGMAFSKPLVVQGTTGFWRLFDERSASLFLYQGFFGHGGGGAQELKSILSALARDDDKRAVLGCFGRSIVEQHFSIDMMADRLIEIYRQTLSEAQNSNERMRSTARTLIDLAKFRTLMGLRKTRRMLKEQWG